MKKILICILVVMFASTNVIFSEEKKFYAVTEEISEINEYVLERANDFIDAMYLDSKKGNLFVSTGICVYDNNEVVEVIYPVFNGKDIVLTIEVFINEGDIGGTCSQNYVNELKILLELTDAKNPLYLFRHDGKNYANVGNSVYNMLDCVEEKSSDFNLTNKRIGACEIMNIIDIDSSTRATGEGYCNWRVYAYHTNLGIYCGPMSLFNIQKNMGWNLFSTYTALAGDISSVCGSSVGMTMEFHHMTQYLTARNYSYSQGSTYMSINSIRTMTYVNHKYGLAFSRTSPTGSGHITAIIGYHSPSYGNYVILFDPHGSGNCRLVVDINSRWFTSSNTQYRWNYGYISNINR